MQEKRFGAFSSSNNPQELATTIQAGLKVLAGIAVAFGVFSTVDANTLIEQVGVLVPIAYTAWNAGEVIFGLLRKVVVRFTERQS